MFNKVHECIDNGFQDAKPCAKRGTYNHRDVQSKYACNIAAANNDALYPINEHKFCKTPVLPQGNYDRR